jgi:hypothetical protein
MRSRLLLRRRHGARDAAAAAAQLQAQQLRGVLQAARRLRGQAEARQVRLG